MFKQCSRYDRQIDVCNYPSSHFEDRRNQVGVTLKLFFERKNGTGQGYTGRKENILNITVT